MKTERTDKGELCYKTCQLYLACCIMEVSLILCVLTGMFLRPTDGHVVANFWDSPDCVKFFYKEKVPELGASQPNVVRLCQRFLNTYHFATLYDTYHHTAVYSAYIFQTSNGGGRESRWFVEPQVSYIYSSTVPSESVDYCCVWFLHPVCFRKHIFLFFCFYFSI